MVGSPSECVKVFVEAFLAKYGPHPALYLLRNSMNRNRLTTQLRGITKKYAPQMAMAASLDGSEPESKVLSVQIMSCLGQHFAQLRAAAVTEGVAQRTEKEAMALIRDTKRVVPQAGAVEYLEHVRLLYMYMCMTNAILYTNSVPYGGLRGLVNSVKAIR